MASLRNSNNINNKRCTPDTRALNKSIKKTKIPIAHTSVTPEINLDELSYREDLQALCGKKGLPCKEKADMLKQSLEEKFVSLCLVWGVQ